MGRLQVDLPADRHTLWDAARREAAGAVLEEQPGKRLVWGGAARNTLELAATGTGCTRARLEHPDGWIEALYWRWWLGRLGRPGWSAGERLAFAAAALTVLAVLTLVPRPARAPFPEVEELVASVTGLGPADDLLLGPGPGVRRFELSAEGQVWHLSLGPNRFAVESGSYDTWRRPYRGEDRRVRFLDSDLTMEDLQLTGFLTQTVPRGRHELVGQTATSWIVSTTLARSPYAAVRSYVRRGADHVHRYDMLDVRGDVVRRLEFADGALTVHTPADGTRTRLTPRR